MSEQSTPPTSGSQVSPAPGAVQAGSPQSQGAVSETKNTVDVAELERKFNERLQGISAILNRLTKEKENAQPPKPTEPVRKPDSATDDSLTGRVQAIERREAALKERERRSQLKAAAEANGVTGVGQDALVEFIFAKRASDINVTDDLQVVVKDGEREVTPTEFVKAFLTTDTGKFFLPARRNPGAPPDSSDAGAASSAPRFNWDAMSFADAMKARENGGYDDWWKWSQAHPGAWEAKRAGKLV